MARLILQTAEGQQAIELRPVNSLGRHPNNSIQLLDKIVSKEHCIIELRGTQFYLRDLGSLNGTFINNERVRGEAPLKHGDEIALGSTRGRFDDSQAPTATMGGAPPTPPPVAPAPPPQPWTSTPQPPVAAPSPLAQSAHVLPQVAQANRPAAPGFVPPGPPRPGPPGPPPPPRPNPPVSGGTPSTQQPFEQSSPPGPHPPLPYNRQQPDARTFVTGPHSYVAQGTRIDLNDQARQIGTQIAAVEKGFLPFDRIANDLNQLRADYERLRLSHELSREIAAERDTTRLLEKILTAIFKFIRADRGVIFLRDDGGELAPRAMQRRDGTTAPISVSSTILNHVVKERAAVLTHDAAMDFAASKGKSMILNRISSAIVVPLVAPNNSQDVLGVLWLDSETLAQFQPKDLELVTAVAHQASMFIEINILGKKIENEIIARERFSRLLSPNIAERVMSGQLEVKQGGQRVEECTVFNSDIRGFTAMSENSKPEILVEMLNEYFELMVDTIFKYEGTLDKFMGDGIMAIWGAPVVHPDDAIRSVQCALEMGEVLGEFNRRRLAKDLSPLAVGIGIHTGPLVAGYIGSSKALSYTVIGDVANTSARLCSVALAGQIVVSETTHERLGTRFETEELPPAKVKGKEKPLRLFNVIRSATSVQVPGAITNEPTVTD
ncbi:adenylate/guanylate cyclase domain-containing protein [Polyangium aurulentum]|uniref:adenylate/guanylate cyclase domain-containing protein n=1 Tax=Polyangium aurulentum TaxID=2567896 RepID=UPI0010AEAF9C|nr:adenylate/guanylate cyclase domain-containing protein [Polyangium aurulentum]UQA60954.1 FHA domain-containing protein [Polyangium aurulentum]